MTTYLIDYENTNAAGLEGVKNLKADDTVVIFYGKQDKQIPIEVVKGLTGAVRVIWKESKGTAKNYLDTLLVTYLGYIIGVESVTETTFVIISKDGDYSAAVDLWSEKRKDLTVKRAASIKAARSGSFLGEVAPVVPTKPVAAKKPAGKSPNPQALPEAARKHIRTVLKPLALEPHHYGTIYSATHKASSLSSLQETLAEKLGKDRGIALAPRVWSAYGKYRKEQEASAAKPQN